MAGWRSEAIWTGLGAVAALVAAVPAAESAVWRRHAEHVLGTSLQMAAVTPDETAAEAAFAAAEAEIARLDPILSGWRPDSELAALNASQQFEASPDLFAVIAACERWRDLTFGAYCARLGAIQDMWREAERRGAAPSRAQLSALAGQIAMSDVALETKARRIARPDDVRFAIDGLAKGYVIDRALDAARLAVPELDGLLIDIGGDVRVWGASPDRTGWRIAIAGAPFDNAAPFAELRVRDKAVATSGGGARDRRIGEASFAHIVSPFTGWAKTAPNQATVIADLAADADALATALSVLPPYEGLKLIERIPGAAALIVDAQGEAWTSALWRGLAHGPAASCQATPAADAVSTPWPANFALTLRYEIPRIEASSYRRPNVVIWISDEQRRLVRTLLVLGDRPRWRESNYVWWRRFERLTPDPVQVVSRPTRAPGRYDLIWDGRDDAGRPVGQGRYTLNIEAAREHGGHSFQAIDLELGAAPVAGQAPAQAEIGAASVQYGLRTP